MSEKITPREASERSARDVAQIKQYDKEARRQDRVAGDYEGAVKAYERDLGEADQVYSENLEYYQQKGMNERDVRDRLESSLSRERAGFEKGKAEAAKYKAFGNSALQGATEHYVANPGAHYQAAVAEAMLDGVHIDTGPEQLHAQNVSIAPVEQQK